MINIAVFASGSGTNFQAIADYLKGHTYINVKLLLCNKPGAKVLDRAEMAGVNSIVFSRQELETSGRIIGILNKHEISFIVLAGFLQLIPRDMIISYPDRIVNIHPALLPKFGGRGMYGARVHEAVIASGDSYSGITIHMVNEEYDKGSIVAQYTCEVMNDDTPESLASRIHKLEHYWYPRVIERLLEID